MRVKIYINDIYLCDGYLANTFIDKLIGYMFRKEPHYEAIIFNKCNSIHTFFMKFNLNLLFIDPNMLVCDKIINIGKGKIVYKKNAIMVIESTNENLKFVNIGDKVIIEKNGIKNGY